ncbi:MAG: Asp-tRNA(Asn)/Glu-tRNA(Gln) amidotransferase subunit GatC [Bacillota bacterium]
MAIDRSLVEHVALLARLQLGEEEKTSLLEQLNKILDHVRRLEEIDVEGVPPTFHVLPDMRNVMRPDEPRPCLPRDLVLLNAPDRAEGQFRVPRVIDSGPREGTGS